jgi:hypothetical protein
MISRTKILMVLLVLVFHLKNEILPAQNNKRSNQNKRESPDPISKLVSGRKDFFSFGLNSKYFDNNFNLLAEGTWCHFFIKGKIFSGIYAESKILSTKAKITLNNNYLKGENLKYGSLGVLCGTQKLKKMKICISLKLGYGRIRFEENYYNKNLNKNDYIYVIIPSIGYKIKINKTTFLNIGYCHHLIGYIDIYFKKNRLTTTGEGVFINICFEKSLF